MARLDESFDARSQDRGQAPGEVLPAGYYLAEIVASAVKPTRDGTGKYIEFEAAILSEGYRGRKTWFNVNIRNRSQEAERIAREQFARLCDSVGLGDRVIDDTAQLHNIPLTLSLVVKPAEGQYKERNEVKGFYDRSKASGIAQPGSAAPQQGHQPPAWQRPVPQQGGSSHQPASSAPAPQQTQAAPFSPPVGHTKPWLKAAAQ